MTDAAISPSFPIRPPRARFTLSKLLHRPLSLEALWSLEGFVLSLYFLRDAMAGAFRYYAAKMHLEPVWFIPDAIAMLTVLAFAHRHVIKSPNIVAILTLLQIVVSLYIGYIFLGTMNGAASAFKMIIPIFVGFCFCGRKLKDYKWVLLTMHVLFYVSIVGILLSARIHFPWVGFAYESFGVTRQAGRLWWALAQERLAGFAADSTMAAFFVLITYVLTSVRRSVVWCLLWAPVAAYAINLTTSKTSVGLLFIYLALLLVIRSLPENNRFPVLRGMALASFLAIFVPILLMIFLSGTDLAHSFRSLYSLQDRINNSWQLPFIYLAKLMPFGFISGCGLGCFNYPQQIFSNITSYYVPVDNFYIGTYLMFGPAFVAFVIAVILAIARTRDIYKLTVVIVMNLFTITVLSYGPASGDDPTLAPGDQNDLVTRLA